MKKLILSLLACGAVIAANAAELQWHTSLPEAQAKARAENKLVFVEFTGSDWCPPCKKLHSEVLDTKGFSDYVAGKFVLVELDFPHQKKQSDELKAANKALAQEFKIKGYPTVIILNADGKELHRKVGYGGESAEEYVADLDKAVAQ